MHSLEETPTENIGEGRTTMVNPEGLESKATHFGARGSATTVPIQTNSLRPKAKSTGQIANPQTDPILNAPPEELQVTGRRHRRFGDFEDHWKHFDEDVKEENEDFIDGLKANLDNLLIFAGLFSAINSGFFFLSVPRLSDDSPADTNGLLVHLIRTIDNSSSIPPNLLPSTFEARTVDIKINSLFSTSLTLSLLAAFGSLFCQQWLIYYKRLTPGARDGRRWDRELKYNRAKHWGLEAVIETALPTLLQVALLIFLVGFLIFLRDLSPLVALPNLILIVAGATAFSLSIVAALWDPFCPFQAPLTTFTRTALYRILLEVVRSGLKLCSLFRWEGRARWFSDVYDKLGPSGSAAEAMKVESVRRILETSTNSKLLFTTAVNMPLLSWSEIGSVFPPSEPPNQRLLGLWNEADKDSDEEAAYSRTIVHLYFTLPIASLPVPEKPDGPDDWGREIFFTLGTRTHLRAPTYTLSAIASSLACVITSYLATPENDRTPTADRELRFFQESIVYERMRVHGDPASALGMVAWLIVARSEKTKMLQNELLQNDIANSMFIEVLDETEKGARIWSWTRVLRMTKNAYQAVGVGRKKDDAVAYVAHAIEAYSPEDPVTHDLVRSLMSGARVLTEEDGLDFNPHRLIVALGSLFSEDRGRDEGTETGRQWESVILSSSLLMKSLFNGDPDRDKQDGIFEETMSKRVIPSPKAMEAITHYVKTMLRRANPKPDHAIIPSAKRLLLFIRKVRNSVKHPMDQHTRYFIKAIALLPEDCFRSATEPEEKSRELHAWVLKQANSETNPIDNSTPGLASKPVP